MGFKLFRRGGNAGGAERNNASPSGAETFVATQDHSSAAKLGLHGLDTVIHDPLESTVGVLSSMCGKDVSRLDKMLDDQYGKKPEDPIIAGQKAEVSRRVKSSWGIVDEAPGTGNSGN